MAANPRAAAVAALVRQEQDGFSNPCWMPNSAARNWRAVIRPCRCHLLHVLEHQGTLDFILEQFLPKGLTRLDPGCKEILQAALAQARYMQVPRCQRR